MSTPQVPSGPHVPAPDESPDVAGATGLDGLASAVDRARRMVPEGTFAVGAGLAISGVTTYGFQILAFRGLSKPDYAALNALWVFVFVLAPGVFLPLEQEVGRAVAARRVRGVGGGPVVRRAGLLGGVFSIVLALGDRRARRRRPASCSTSSTVTSGSSCAWSSRCSRSASSTSRAARSRESAGSARTG